MAKYRKKPSNPDIFKATYNCIGDEEEKTLTLSQDYKFKRVGFGYWPRFIVVNNIIRANAEDKGEILMINIDQIETIEPKSYISGGLTHAVIQMTSGSSYSTEETVEQIMNLIQEECVQPQLLGE